MKQLYVPTRAQWRKWLVENHRREPDGIWLVFHRKGTAKPTLAYEESVEEALCFGWVDSIIKRLDDGKFCRKFTPRRFDSSWSSSNKERAEKMIQAGRMTEFGLAKIKAAKKSGIWKEDPRPIFGLEPPKELSAALARNPIAKDNFEKLPPSHRKQYLGWILTAKRPETRARRIKEAVTILGRGQKLGLK